MSVTIELDSEVEERARKRALQKGQDLSGYLKLLVRQDEAEASKAQSAPLSTQVSEAEPDIPEYLKGYVGVVNSKDCLSKRK